MGRELTLRTLSEWRQRGSQEGRPSTLLTSLPGGGDLLVFNPICWSSRNTSPIWNGVKGGGDDGQAWGRGGGTSERQRGRSLRQLRGDHVDIHPTQVLCYIPCDLCPPSVIYVLVCTLVVWAPTPVSPDARARSAFATTAQVCSAATGIAVK